MGENEWANGGDREPATAACLGRADGFPWTRVRGLVGGIAVQVSTFSLGGAVCKEELVPLGPEPLDLE